MCIGQKLPSKVPGCSTASLYAICLEQGLGSQFLVPQNPVNRNPVMQVNTWHLTSV